MQRIISGWLKRICGFVLVLVLCLSGASAMEFHPDSYLWFDTQEEAKQYLQSCAETGTVGVKSIEVAHVYEAGVTDDYDTMVLDFNRFVVEVRKMGKESGLWQPIGSLWYFYRTIVIELEWDDTKAQEIAYAPVYDYDEYMAANPDVNTALGGDRAAMLQHFFTSGMAEGRIGRASFNVQHYRANYPDLAAVFGSDLRSYYEHYVHAGQAEGRVADRLIEQQPSTPAADDSAYAAVYDYDYYIAKYPDIAAAFNGDRAATLDHFLSSGMAEGRQGIGSFHVEYYRANYADLQSAFGSDLKAYYTHYMSNGKAEGRVANKLLTTDTPEQPDVSSRESYYAPVYDFDYYVGKYADIAAAFGGDRAATLEHFVNHGMSEGRQGSAEFNVNAYRGNYPDLEAAFGGDLDDYYKHYINHGKGEGRSGK